MMGSGSGCPSSACLLVFSFFLLFDRAFLGCLVFSYLDPPLLIFLSSFVIAFLRPFSPLFLFLLGEDEGGLFAYSASRLLPL